MKWFTQMCVVAIFMLTTATANAAVSLQPSPNKTLDPTDILGFKPTARSPARVVICRNSSFVRRLYMMELFGLDPFRSWMLTKELVERGVCIETIKWLRKSGVNYCRFHVDASCGRLRIWHNGELWYGLIAPQQ